MRIYGRAVPHNNTIYFGCFDGKLYGLDMTNGENVFQFQTDASKQGYTDLFQPTGGFKEDFTLYGEDWIGSENKILELGSFVGSPTIENNVLYIGDANGWLYAIDVNH